MPRPVPAPPARRTAAARGPALTAVLSAAALAFTCCPAAADTGGPAAGSARTPAGPGAGTSVGPMPTAVATRGGSAAPVKDVLRGCEQHRAACSFAIDPDKGGEFMTAVTNVSTAVVNCSNAPMTVTRNVVLKSSTTDNISGEISGSATHEGTVDKTLTGTTSATGKLTTSNSNTQHTAPKDKGPNSDTTNATGTETSGTGTATDTLHLGVREAFTAAFKLAYSKSWTSETTETTDYKTTLSPNDILVLSAQNAMVRTQGKLRVNDNQNGSAGLVKDVTVDSPSTVNAGSLVAQTFTDANRCSTLRPASNANDPQPSKQQPSTPGQPEQPKESKAAASALRAMPAGGGSGGLYETEAPHGLRPRSTVVLHPAAAKRATPPSRPAHGD